MNRFKKGKIKQIRKHWRDIIMQTIDLLTFGSSSVPLLKESTPSELKLLQKTIGLAERLQSGLVIIAELTSQERFRILLAALLKVSKAINGVDKLLGVTEKYIELVKLLSYFTFPQALKLLQESKWAMIVQQRLECHRIKSFFSKWKTQAKKSSLQLPSYLATGRRRVASTSEYQKLMEREEGKSPLQIAFTKWRLCMLGNRILDHQITRRIVITFKGWQKQMRLTRRYRNYFGLEPEMVLTRTLSEFSLQSVNNEKDKARFVFREWRGIAKLQRRRISNLIQDKQSVFETWQAFCQRRQGRYNLGSMYDSARNIRPAFCSWLGAYTRRLFCTEKANDHHKMTLLTKHLDRWTDHHRRIAKLSQRFGRWRGVADFCRRTHSSAVVFYKGKAVARIFKAWHTKTATSCSAQSLATKMAQRRTYDRTKFFLTTWRRALGWIVRSSEKVYTLRAAKDARTCLNQWRLLKRDGSAAEFYYRTSFARKVLCLWKKRLQTVRFDHTIKANCLATWRRTLRTKRSILQYLSRKRGSSLVQSKTSQSFNVELLSAIKFFSLWHRKAQLNRMVEIYEAVKQRHLKNDYLKGWRMDANVSYYLRQRPWRVKRRVFRHFRAVGCKLSKSSKAMDDLLMEQLRSRQYVTYYRFFEKWQQLFQAKKMEEHLCSQNLAYYQHRQKCQIMHIWQVAGASRLLVKVRNLNDRKKIFNSWHRNSSASLVARDRRIKIRSIRRWRESFRTSIGKDLLKQSNRKQTRLIFISWRSKTKNQQISHSKSIEFIGQSTVRYVLQKWRMESVYRQSLKNSFTINDYPRYLLNLGNGERRRGGTGGGGAGPTTTTTLVQSHGQQSFGIVPPFQDGEIEYLV